MRKFCIGKGQNRKHGLQLPPSCHQIASWLIYIYTNISFYICTILLFAEMYHFLFNFQHCELSMEQCSSFSGNGFWLGQFLSLYFCFHHKSGGPN